MGKALECDACGDLYRFYEGVSGVKLTGNGHNLIKSEWDLCPKCIGEIADILEADLKTGRRRKKSDKITQKC